MQYACIHGLSALACAKLHNFSKDAHHLTRKIPPLTKFFFKATPLSFLLCRVTGEPYSEFFEYLVVDFAEHYCRMHLTSVKFG